MTSQIRLLSSLFLVAAVALKPAASFAADIPGTPSDDDLSGTSGPDTIDGKQADDTTTGDGDATGFLSNVDGV